MRCQAIISEFILLHVGISESGGNAKIMDRESCCMDCTILLLTINLGEDIMELENNKI